MSCNIGIFGMALGRRGEFSNFLRWSFWAELACMKMLVQCVAAWALKRFKYFVVFGSAFQSPTQSTAFNVEKRKSVVSPF